MSGSGKTRAAKAKEAKEKEKEKKQTQLVQTTLTQGRRSSVPAVLGATKAEVDRPQNLAVEDMAAGGSEGVLKQILEQLAALNQKVDNQSLKIDQATSSIQKLTDQVSQHTQAIEKLQGATAENRNLAGEAIQIATAAKKEVEEVKGEVRPLQKQIGEQQAYLSMVELKERQNNLRLRAIPEIEQQDLIGFLTTEFSKFWNIKEESDFKIVSAFRLGRLVRKDRSRDCLIILRSREERDKILGLHFANPLDIQDKRVQIYRDIPKQLLDLRTTYSELARLLRLNTIRYRWEFPQGISFTYKQKKVKIRTPEDSQKFLHEHGEDLQKEAAAHWPLPQPELPPGGGKGPIPSELQDKEETPL